MSEQNKTSRALGTETGALSDNYSPIPAYNKSSDDRNYDSAWVRDNDDSRTFAETWPVDYEDAQSESATTDAPQAERWERVELSPEDTREERIINLAKDLFNGKDRPREGTNDYSPEEYDIALSISNNAFAKEFYSLTKLSEDLDPSFIRDYMIHCDPDLCNKIIHFIRPDLVGNEDAIKEFFGKSSIDVAAEVLPVFSRSGASAVPIIRQINEAQKKGLSDKEILEKIYLPWVKANNLDKDPNFAATNAVEAKGILQWYMGTRYNPAMAIAALAPNETLLRDSLSFLVMNDGQRRKFYDELLKRPVSKESNKNIAPAQYAYQVAATAHTFKAITDGDVGTVISIALKAARESLDTVWHGYFKEHPEDKGAWKFSHMVNRAQLVLGKTNPEVLELSDEQLKTVVGEHNKQCLQQIITKQEERETARRTAGKGLLGGGVNSTAGTSKIKKLNEEIKALENNLIGKPTKDENGNVSLVVDEEALERAKEMWRKGKEIDDKRQKETDIKMFNRPRVLEDSVSATVLGAAESIGAMAPVVAASAGQRYAIYAALSGTPAAPLSTVVGAVDLILNIAYWYPILKADSDQQYRYDRYTDPDDMASVNKVAGLINSATQAVSMEVMMFGAGAVGGAVTKGAAKGAAKGVSEVALEAGGKTANSSFRAAGHWWIRATSPKAWLYMAEHYDGLMQSVTQSLIRNTARFGTDVAIEGLQEASEEAIKWGVQAYFKAHPKDFDGKEQTIEDITKAMAENFKLGSIYGAAAMLFFRGIHMGWNKAVIRQKSFGEVDAIRAGLGGARNVRLTAAAIETNQVLGKIYKRGSSIEAQVHNKEMRERLYKYLSSSEEDRANIRESIWWRNMPKETKNSIETIDVLLKQADIDLNKEIEDIKNDKKLTPKAKEEAIKKLHEKMTSQEMLASMLEGKYVNGKYFNAEDLRDAREYVGAQFNRKVAAEALLKYREELKKAEAEIEALEKEKAEATDEAEKKEKQDEIDRIKGDIAMNKRTAELMRKYGMHLRTIMKEVAAKVGESELLQRIKDAEIEKEEFRSSYADWEEQELHPGMKGPSTKAEPARPRFTIYAKPETPTPEEEEKKFREFLNNRVGRFRVMQAERKVAKEMEKERRGEKIKIDENTSKYRDELTDEELEKLDPEFVARMRTLNRSRSTVEEIIRNAAILDANTSIEEHEKATAERRKQAKAEEAKLKTRLDQLYKTEIVEENGEKVKRSTGEIPELLNDIKKHHEKALAQFNADTADIQKAIKKNEKEIDEGQDQIKDIARQIKHYDKQLPKVRKEKHTIDKAVKTAKDKLSRAEAELADLRNKYKATPKSQTGKRTRLHAKGSAKAEEVKEKKEALKKAEAAQKEFNKKNKHYIEKDKPSGESTVWGEERKAMQQQLKELKDKESAAWKEITKLTAQLHPEEYRDAYEMYRDAEIQIAYAELKEINQQLRILNLFLRSTDPNAKTTVARSVSTIHQVDKVLEEIDVLNNGIHTGDPDSDVDGIRDLEKQYDEAQEDFDRIDLAYEFYSSYTEVYNKRKDAAKERDRIIEKADLYAVTGGSLPSISDVEAWMHSAEQQGNTAHAKDMRDLLSAIQRVKEIDQQIDERLYDPETKKKYSSKEIRDFAKYYLKEAREAEDKRNEIAENIARLSQRVQALARALTPEVRNEMKLQMEQLKAFDKTAYDEAQKIYKKLQNIMRTRREATEGTPKVTDHAYELSSQYFDLLKVAERARKRVGKILAAQRIQSKPTLDEAKTLLEKAEQSLSKIVENKSSSGAQEKKARNRVAAMNTLVEELKIIKQADDVEQRFGKMREEYDSKYKPAYKYTSQPKEESKEEKDKDDYKNISRQPGEYTISDFFRERDQERHRERVARRKTPRTGPLAAMLEIARQKILNDPAIMSDETRAKRIKEEVRRMVFEDSMLGPQTKELLDKARILSEKRWFSKTYNGIVDYAFAYLCGLTNSPARDRIIRAAVDAIQIEIDANPVEPSLSDRYKDDIEQVAYTEAALRALRAQEYISDGTIFEADRAQVQNGRKNTDQTRLYEGFSTEKGVTEETDEDIGGEEVEINERTNGFSDEEEIYSPEEGVSADNGYGLGNWLACMSVLYSMREINGKNNYKLFDGVTEDSYPLYAAMMAVKPSDKIEFALFLLKQGRSTDLTAFSEVIKNRYPMLNKVMFRSDADAMPIEDALLVKKWLKSFLGTTLELKDGTIVNGHLGYFVPQLNTIVTPKENTTARTLVHELGHALCQWGRTHYENFDNIVDRFIAEAADEDIDSFIRGRRPHYAQYYRDFYRRHRKLSGRELNNAVNNRVREELFCELLTEREGITLQGSISMAKRQTLMRRFKAFLTKLWHAIIRQRNDFFIDDAVAAAGEKMSGTEIMHMVITAFVNGQQLRAKVSDRNAEATYRATNSSAMKDATTANDGNGVGPISPRDRVSNFYSELVAAWANFSDIKIPEAWEVSNVAADEEIKRQNRHAQEVFGMWFKNKLFRTVDQSSPYSDYVLKSLGLPLPGRAGELKGWARRLFSIVEMRDKAYEPQGQVKFILAARYYGIAESDLITNTDAIKISKKVSELIELHETTNILEKADEIEAYINRVAIVSEAEATANSIERSYLDTHKNFSETRPETERANATVFEYVANQFYHANKWKEKIEKIKNPEVAAKAMAAYKKELDSLYQKLTHPDEDIDSGTYKKLLIRYRALKEFENGSLYTKSIEETKELRIMLKSMQAKSTKLHAAKKITEEELFASMNPLIKATADSAVEKTTRVKSAVAQVFRRVYTVREGLYTIVDHASKDVREEAHKWIDEFTLEAHKAWKDQHAIIDDANVKLMKSAIKHFEAKGLLKWFDINPEAIGAEKTLKTKRAILANKKARALAAAVIHGTLGEVRTGSEKFSLDGETKLTVGQLLNLYKCLTQERVDRLCREIATNPGGLYAVLDAHGIDRKKYTVGTKTVYDQWVMRKELEEFLGDDVIEFGKEVSRHLVSLSKDINRASEELVGMAVASDDPNYWTITRSISEEMMNKAPTEVLTVLPSTLIERVDSLQPIDEQAEFYAVFSRHMFDISHFIAYSEIRSRIRALIQAPEYEKFRQNIIRSCGKAHWVQIREHLAQLYNGYMAEGEMYKTTGETIRNLRVFSRVMAMFVSPSAGFVQLLGSAAAPATTIGWRQMGSSILYVARHPDEFFECARELLYSDEWRARNKDQNAVMLSILSRSSTHGILKGMNPQARWLLSEINAFGMSPASIGDRGPSLFWGAAYMLMRKHQLEHGIGNEKMLTGEEAKKRALLEASRMTDETQQARDIQNLDAFTRSPDDVNRLLIQFRTSPLQYAAKEARAWEQFCADKTGENFAKWAAIALHNHIVAPVLALIGRSMLLLLLKMFGLKRDDKDLAELIRFNWSQLVPGSLSSIPIAGWLASYFSALAGDVVTGKPIKFNGSAKSAIDVPAFNITQRFFNTLYDFGLSLNDDKDDNVGEEFETLMRNFSWFRSADDFATAMGYNPFED